MVYFVDIHPSVYGNGRTSRLLLQDHVYRYGYGPVILPEPMKRTNYLKIINAGGDGRPEELVCMYLRAVILRLQGIKARSCRDMTIDHMLCRKQAICDG